ncbi:MAG TPA: MFS transporter [Candidatus Paceibacterota bacterium]
MEGVAPNGIGGMVRKTFYSLRTRNFRLYFTGQLISNTGNWLTNVALILLVLKITGSGLDVGLLAACQYGPILFLSAYGGAIADRFDKRKMLLISQSLEMAQSASLAVLAFMPHPSLVWLYALAILGGIFLAFDNPFRRSFVTEMVPSEDIPNAVVLYSTVVNGSRIVGPALAGLLATTLGFGWCFTIDATSYIAVIVGIIMMRPAELFRRPPEPRAERKGEVREGFRYILSTPFLWISFVMLALIGTLAYNFTVTLPLFVTSSLHSTDAVFTVLYSTFALGAVICGLIVAHRNLVTMRHILIGAAALGVTMLFLAISPGVWMAALAVFLVGMASILYMTSTTTIIQVEGKPEMHGRVLALQMVFVAGTSVIGGPLSGWLADALGARSPLIFGGIVCLAAAAFGYYATQRYMK